MKTLFKQIIGIGLGLAIGISIGNAQQLVQAGALSNTNAVTTSTNTTTNNLTVVLTNAAYVSQIQVVSGALGTPVTLLFFDSTNTALTVESQYGLSNPAFANTNSNYSRATIVTNQTNVLTNGIGQVYTNIYVGQYTTNITNGPFTNPLPPLQSFTVPANSTLSRNTRIQAINGLIILTPPGGTNLTYTVFYAFPF